MSPKQAAEPSARGEREWHGVFKKGKEAESLECGEWQEIRVATHPGDSHYQFGLDRSELGGRKNRQVGRARLQHIAEAKKPDPWTSQGGRKIFKKKFSPVSRTYWRVRSASHRPHIPSNSFSLWGLPDTATPCTTTHTCTCFRKGKWIPRGE